MTIDPVVRVCAVCARVLEVAEGRGWFHVYNPDGHTPVPVEPTAVAVAGVCDFCHAPDPRFELPADRFVYPEQPGDASHGAWACCGTCAQLIERRGWEVVIERAVASFARRHGVPMPPDVRRLLRGVYRELRRHATGPVRPLVWPPTIEEDR